MGKLMLLCVVEISYKGVCNNFRQGYVADAARYNSFAIVSDYQYCPESRRCTGAYKVSIQSIDSLKPSSSPRYPARH